MSKHGSCEAEYQRIERLDDFCFRAIHLAFKALEISQVRKNFMKSDYDINGNGPSFSSFRTSLTGLIKLFDTTAHLSNRPIAEPVAQLFPIKNVDMNDLSEKIEKLRHLCFQFEPTALYRKPFAHYNHDIKTSDESAEHTNQFACILFAEEYLTVFNELVGVINQNGLKLHHTFEEVHPTVEISVSESYL